jgi:hypothetical protein
MRSLRRSTLGATALVLVLVLAGGVGTALAQQTFPNVKVAGRLQEQFYFFDNGDYAATVGQESNIFLRRARIEARGQISENVSFIIQPSFEGGRALSSTATTCTSTAVPDGGGTPTLTCRTTGRSGIRLRDAYIDVRLTPEQSATAFYLRGGQEKRPFGRYELISSTNLPSIERGAGSGLLGRASNNIFESAGFLSHDVGASIRVEHKLDEVRMVRLTAGAYNGEGESVTDVNGAKSFGVRGTVGVTPKLDLGASYFSHDGVVGTDSSFNNAAFGIDASWNKPGEAGLFLVGDYMQGEDRSAAKNDMRGVSLVGAYNIRMSSPTSWLYAIEPALRYDFADPNVDADDDGVSTATAVLGFYLSSRTQFRLAYERQSFQAGTEAISGLRSALTLNF